MNKYQRLTPLMIGKGTVTVHKALATMRSGEGQMDNLTPACGKAVFMFHTHETQVALEQPNLYAKTHLMIRTNKYLAIIVKSDVVQLPQKKY